MSDTDFGFEIVERKIFGVVEVVQVEAISQWGFFSKGLVLAVKKFDPVCCVCTTPLNPEETKLFKNRKKEYLSVIPCCQNESCIKKNIKFESGKYSGWICKRKRGSLLNQKEEKKKRKAQHDIAQARINKRRKKVPIPKD